MRIKLLSLVVCLATLEILVVPVARQAPPAQAASRPNVVIFMSDDQRFDMLTAQFMPNVYDRLIVGNPYAFTNSFVPNPLCCPSRTSTLTGNYSHTTGVWYNNGPYGGFGAFDDRHTIARDFDRAGYRTAMIGKYLNGYRGGHDSYIPPGWDRWFATNTGAFYDYGVTTNKKLLQFGSRPKDYIGRVLDTQAVGFVNSAVAANDPFFLFYSFTAPHHPSTPDPRDIGRFTGVDAGPPDTNEKMLASAYSVDRAVGHLMDVLPPNTIIVYMSDNGYLWRESKGTWGELVAKQWPYDESIRVPIIISGTTLTAGVNDIVLNVDLRKTLTRAAGVSPLTRSDGINLGSDTYASRTVFPLEHYQERESGQRSRIPTYCGAREANTMYVRYRVLEADGTFKKYLEELYVDANNDETTNVAADPLYSLDLQRMRQAAVALCDPTPPHYHW